MVDSVTAEIRAFADSDVQLDVAQHGAGTPVVFLHGITANWAVWTPVLKIVGRHCQAVAISQRGHGRSSAPPVGYLASDFASDVAMVVKSLGSGAAVVVGHSLGARNAVVAGRMYPDLVRAVVSIEWVPGISYEAVDALERRVNAGSRRFESREAVLEYLAGRYTKLPIEAIRYRADFGFDYTDPRSIAPLAAPHAMAATASGLFADYQSDYEAVSCPMIAVRGAESRLVSAEEFDIASKMHPDAQHVIASGCDHYVPEEDPQLISQIVKRALALTQA